MLALVTLPLVMLLLAAGAPALACPDRADLAEALRTTPDPLGAARLATALEACWWEDPALDTAQRAELAGIRDDLLYGEQRGAFDRLEALIAVAPDAAQPRFLRGRLLQQLRRFEAAAADYEHALAQAPDHFEALYQLGVLALETGDGAVTEARLQAVLDRHPHHAPTLALLAELARLGAGTRL